MNLGHLRSKIRKLTEDHEDEEMENGELNLVPYLDIVTNVIMFLMMTTTFAAALTNINVSAPNRAQGGSGDNSQQPRNELNLTVSISEKGFTIACSGGVMFEGCKLAPNGEFTDCAPGNKVPTLPSKNGQYDYAGLTKKMREIKSNSAASNETKVIVNANPEIVYEILVNTMDAIRNDGPKLLFPDVLLAAGVN